MYHKLIAMVTIAVVITSFSQASARELDSAELKTLFSNSTVKWTTRKGIKVTLSLKSDGSAKALVVTPQGEVRREGKWWIKEPNIHCLKWVNRKKNICRKIGNVEESGEGWTTNRKGITWTITKIKKPISKAELILQDMIYGSDLRAFETLQKTLETNCKQNIKCAFDNVWTYLDISGDDHLSLAEISRFQRNIVKLVAVQQKKKTEEIAAMNIASIIFFPITASSVLHSFDYNNDGLLSKNEVFSETEFAKFVGVDAKTLATGFNVQSLLKQLQDSVMFLKQLTPK